jgi:hypothetical protein
MVPNIEEVFFFKNSSFPNSLKNCPLTLRPDYGQIILSIAKDLGCTLSYI